MELSKNIGLSHVFNVENLVLYKGSIPATDQSLTKVINEAEELQLPSISSPKAKKVLSSWVSKKIGHKTYWEYLIEWKGKEDAKATWVKETKFQKLGIDPRLAT